METNKENELLDFLTEGFLQQGASVTFIKVGKASALKVTAEDIPSRIFIPAEEEVSKMSFFGRAFFRRNFYSGAEVFEEQV